MTENQETKMYKNTRLTCKGPYCMQKPVNQRKPVPNEDSECPRCYKDSLIIEMGMIPKFEPTIRLSGWE